jgi:hypothetical protein
VGGGNDDLRGGKVGSFLMCLSLLYSVETIITSFVRRCPASEAAFMFAVCLSIINTQDDTRKAVKKMWEAILSNDGN